MDRNKLGSVSKMKNATKQKEEKMVDLANKIDETDEMKLKMLAAMEKPEPEDLLYPAELNAHLIEQLKVTNLVILLYEHKSHSPMNTTKKY